MSEAKPNMGDGGVADAIGNAAKVATAIIGLVTTLKQFGTLPNVPFPTLGGKVFWNTLAEKDGWKVQKNMITGHCRVLNPGNVRMAWGFSEEALLAELQKVAGQNS